MLAAEQEEHQKAQQEEEATEERLGRIRFFDHGRIQFFVRLRF